MLEFLRRSSTSLFAWLILGLLAAAFGLSFGLPSDSLTLGPSPLAKVHGTKIGDDDYAVQLNLTKAVTRVPKDENFQRMIGFKEEVLEGTLEREVLAHAAEDIGLAATVRDAEDLTANGHLIVYGDTWDWLGDTAFDYRLFANAHLRNLQATEKKYLEFQRKEYLARTLRDLLTSSVAIGEGELRALYERENNRLAIEYAVYDPGEIGPRIDLSVEELSQWIESHRDALEASYEGQKKRFTELDPQVRLWVIEIPKGEDETSQAEAEANIAAAQAALAGGMPFPRVARRYSRHATARAGGDHGWVNVGPGFGLDPEVDAALPELTVERGPVKFEGASSHFLIQVTGAREGDVPLEAALLELAEDDLRSDRARAVAQSLAEYDLARLQNDGDPRSTFAATDDLDDLAEDDARPAPVRVPLRDSGWFSRGEPVPGLGAANELSAEAWDAEPDTFLHRVFAVGDRWVIARLTRKSEADAEGFETARDELYRELHQKKASTVISTFAARRCLEAKNGGKLSVNEGRVRRFITYDVDGQDQSVPYEPCERVGNRGGFLRMGGL